MKFMPALVLGLSVAGVGGWASPVEAGVITFTTPTNASTSGPVNAKATITTSAGSIQITLQNLEADPVDVAQAISSLKLTLSGSTAGDTLSGSSGTPRNIGGKKSGPTYSDSAPASTGWILTPSGTTLLLDALSTGGPGPTALVIGPPAADNQYDHANGSINGNGPHNPFLAPTATFTVSAPGVTGSTTVSAAVFQFGTTDGANQITGQPSAVPEPASACVLALGLAALFRRRGARPA